MYGLIPDDWGAYARPWVTELAAPLECLKALHLRRMVVTDNDLAELVRARGHMLQELKLDKCTGFSTDGLRLVAHSCREKAWFSSSVKSRLQYLGPQPGIPVLDDEHVKGVHLDPLAGPVDAFCLMVLDPEKRKRPTQFPLEIVILQ
ncbi:unnamed protein product [Miscanthus lutarioriparius]|uniref:Transport inhibitor response 1 domain-containing protein n=1 Tax=Miscanthus lutarioriparius TaxID=422564 RepID=A0A811R1D1_9POAL|nr:unnamed protein product [Miscanthus lutarioriparius]